MHFLERRTSNDIEKNNMSMIASGFVGSSASKEEMNSVIDPKYSTYPTNMTDMS